ncbi:flagellar motor switch protein [Desemzia sp. RIT804]|uniref:flagellar motor switch protein n=1 Tax=Desemzia sp. RIT 804 TaxID=2810209 RepID=UPI001951F6F2|nr:flagellar motor switch protein [Desemzia sp. RIT 804]MBM6614713.1 flagellar motor switch protein [Desemzia sp. RIT 804]
MSQEKSLIELLTDFVELLKTEKEALIQNDAEKVVEIVSKKQVFLETLETLTPDSFDDARLKEPLAEIKQLQETNLMLTKTALQFQETVLKAITQTVKSSGNTYSKKGYYKGNEQATLINQSL